MLLREALLKAMEANMHRVQAELGQRKRELEMLSPYRVLERGYAIVTRGGKPVSAGQLAVGDGVSIRFADGIVGARVESEKEG